MELLFPYRLALLLLVAPLIWFLVRAERTRISRLARLSVPTRFDWKRILFPAVVTSLLCVALARPYSGFKDIQLETEGQDIVVAVDVSYSMLATDVSPSRLEIAKRKIFDLIDAANRRALHVRIGIVTFAGSAFRYCPLTADLEIVRTFAENLSPEVMTSRGSTLEGAVDVSIQVLAQVKSQHGTVIILSDGEDLQFDIKSIEDLLKKSGVPVFAIGIGDTQGVPIPRGNGRYFTGNKGEIVITKLLEDPLRAITSVGGGTYQRADLTGGDIEKILSLSGSNRAASLGIKTIRSYHEIGSWFAAPILLLTAVLLLFRRESLLFIFALLVSLSAPSSLRAEETPPSPRKAYEAYHQGDFETAMRGFAAELQRNPEDVAAAQGLGSALFRLKRYDEAAKVFDSMATSSKTGREKFQALYDSANSHLMKQDLDGAISRYENALKIKPDDIPASSNLELAKRLKEEKQKQEQQQQSQGDSSSQQQSSEQNQSQSQQEQENQRNSQDGDQSSQDSSQQSDQSEGQQQSSASSNGSEKSGSSSQQSSAGTGASSQSSQGDSGSENEQPQSSEGGSSEGESSNSSPAEGDQSSAPPRSPTPSPGERKNPLKELDSLEDRPLLPKQRRNRDTDFLTGQTW